jgi:hypothetical protein
MISPSLGSLSTGRSENSVSSLIAGNFSWQKLPEGSGTFEITASPAHTNDALSRNKNIADLSPFAAIALLPFVVRRNQPLKPIAQLLYRAGPDRFHLHIG